MNYIYIFMFSALIIHAQDSESQKMKPLYTLQTYQFDLQGHRGARGLAPENSLQGFVKAFSLGVNTMELDVVITKDKQVVVSHEPWMHSKICKKPDGSAISEIEEKQLNIYEMTYEEVRDYDCGSLFLEAFPEQVLAIAHKPLLKDVLRMIDSLAKNHGRKISYNMEIKSLPEGDHIYHPTPEMFAAFVVKAIESESDIERVTLQSFDFRVLRHLHQEYPSIKMAALVYEESFEAAMTRLDFKPHIYSPYYKMVDKKLVKSVHAEGMKIIPWTVNEVSDMKRLLKYGVDGIITDYPDRAITLKNSY